MNIKKLFWWCICGLLLPLQSCNDKDELQSEAHLLRERVEALETAIKQMNESVGSLQGLLSGKQIVGITAIDKGYKVELSDGQSFDVLNGEAVNTQLPLLSISSEGYWQYKLSASETYTLMLDKDGKPIKAYPTNTDGAPIASPRMRVSADGYWQVSTDGGSSYLFLMQDGKRVAATPGVGSNSVFSQVGYDSTKEELTVTLSADGTSYRLPVINTFFLTVKGAEGEQLFPLAETRAYEVEQGEIAEATIQAPQGWKVVLDEKELRITAPDRTDAEKQETINLLLTSPKHYIRVVTIQTKLLTTRFDANACTAWKEFATGDPANVLLDFSYAGYMHGESAPPEASTLTGYKIYNVKDYGAIAGDNLSDREAFYRALIAAGAKRSAEAADGTTRFQATNLNAIIYFPEGEYVLQGEGENNKPIHLTMGNLLIRGAGRGKTTLRMDTENQATVPSDMWSAPSMLTVKHYSGVSDLTTVSADAPKGSFSVEVASTTGIRTGDWLCLSLKNNAPALITQELSPMPANDLPANGDLRAGGVTVLDYHQVKSVSARTITFVEPLMHAVEASWGWKVQKFPHYENVGIEDLTFQGKAKDDFLHHGSAADDGGYKPIEFGRLTNAWMRRVDFVSVSEALTMTGCANSSAYDIHIGGNRGHSAIRSAGSSRVFIGKVTDESDGYQHLTSGIDRDNYIRGAGQYHACGVSKQSLGAVIWNVKWGSDACFESHATQPRATLIDRCQGAFIPWRQGGDELQIPNHLDDLIVWNMNATLTASSSGWNNQFIWWDAGSKWWKCLPPTLIGFHGASISFAETFKERKQYKRLESQGTRVAPYSLYEAQLRARLGCVPAWLNSLN